MGSSGQEKRNRAHRRPRGIWGREGRGEVKTARKKNRERGSSFPDRDSPSTLAVPRKKIHPVFAAPLYSSSRKLSLPRFFPASRYRPVKRKPEQARVSKGKQERERQGRGASTRKKTKPESKQRQAKPNESAAVRRDHLKHMVLLRGLHMQMDLFIGQDPFLSVRKTFDQFEHGPQLWRVLPVPNGVSFPVEIRRQRQRQLTRSRASVSSLKSGGRNVFHIGVDPTLVTPAAIWTFRLSAIDPKRLSSASSFRAHSDFRIGLRSGLIFWLSGSASTSACRRMRGINCAWIGELGAAYDGEH